MALTPRDFPAASVPPGTRAEALADRAQMAADKDLRMLIVSSFTDWLAIGCMTLLIGIGALSGETFGWSIPALASGTIYAKMRGAKTIGTGGGSTTAALLIGGPFAIKAIASVLGRAVVGAALLLLVGCGAQQMDAANPIAVAKRVESRLPIMASDIIGLCVPQPTEPKALAHCESLRESFNYIVGKP